MSVRDDASDFGNLTSIIARRELAEDIKGNGNEVLRVCFVSEVLYNHD